MKEIPSARISDGEPISPASVLREVVALPGLGEAISVRAAKAHLSALLNLVENGREIIITSAGKPKARLAPWQASQRKRVPFTGTREHLATMPKWDGGPAAEDIIREDRDGRGW
jgi:prevent-host-death family protein